MWHILDRYFRVHSNDEITAQRVKMLSVIILIMAAGVAVFIVTDLILNPNAMAFLPQEIIILVVFAVLFVFARRGHRWPPYVLLSFLAIAAPAILEVGTPMMPAIALPIAVVPLIAPSLLAVPVAALEIITFFVIRLMQGDTIWVPEIPIVLGILGVLAWFASSSVENALRTARQNAQALAESNQALQASGQELERQATALARRARYLEITAAVSRDVASILDQDALLSQLVNLIGERFEFYHVGLFLLDVTGHWMVLRAASSAGGQRMLRQGYRLQVGEGGAVGLAAARGVPQIMSDVGDGSVQFNNPDLPDTRFEMAIPLLIGEEAIGVLDVQSQRIQSFSEEDIAVLQSLADQAAVAINNARLFRRLEESREAERRAFGEARLEGWQRLLREEPNLGFVSTRYGMQPVSDVWYPEMEAALREAKPSSSARPAQSAASYAVPVRAGGEVIGVIDGRKSSDARWTADEMALLEALATQLGEVIERARLYRETQRTAARERIIGQVSGRIRQELDLEAVLKTTVDQIQQALGLEKAAIRLVGDAADQQAADQRID